MHTNLSETFVCFFSLFFIERASTSPDAGVTLKAGGSEGLGGGGGGESKAHDCVVHKDSFA